MTDLGSEALPVVWELFRRGIYVQDGAGWGLPTFLRISVGLSEHHQVLLAALGEIRSA